MKMIIGYKDMGQNIFKTEKKREEKNIGNTIGHKKSFAK